MRWTLFALLALAGCTTSVDEMSYSQLQQYASRMAEECAKQGVPDEQLDACVEQEIRADQARRMRQRQIGAAISGASQAYGDSLQRRSVYQPSISCRSVRAVDGAIRTDCY